MADAILQRPVFEPRSSWLALLTMLALGLLLAWPGNVSATDRSARQTRREEPIPPPLIEYKGRTIAPTMSYQGAPWLVRESRAREEGSEQLLAALEIQPGQVVCDMGCGNGYYTLKLAKLVGPRGRVLAVDIQPEMLELLSVQLRRAKIDHVGLILGTVVDPKLPDGEVDMALLVDVYHEFSHPEHMLRAIRKSLKPEGLLVLVEFRGEDPEVPIKPLHKMTKAQILKEVPPNGFRLVRQYDELPWQHVMCFQPIPLQDDGKDK